MTDTEKWHPQLWALSQGFLVVDPDGWRSAGREFADHVTRHEFNLLAGRSTITENLTPGMITRYLHPLFGCMSNVRV